MRPISDSELHQVDMASTIVNMMDGFFRPIDRMASFFTGSGTNIVYALVLITIAMGGIQLAAGTTDLFDLAIQGIKLSFVGSLVLACMVDQAWLGYLTGTGPTTIPKEIERGFMSIMSGFSPTFAGTSVSSSSGEFLGAVISDLFTSIKIMMGLSFWDRGLSNPLTIVSSFITLIPTILLWVFSVIAFCIAGALILGEAFATVIAIKLAFAFTGLLVPWLLFRPLQFLFDAWLKTLLISFTALVIAALFVAGMASFGTAIQAELARIPTTGFFSGPQIQAIMSPVFIGSLILITIATKVNSMAQTLLSGGALSGIGIHAFSQAMKATQGVTSAPGGAAAKASGMTSAGANMAKSVASKGMSMGKSAASGIGAVAGAAKAAASPGLGSAKTAFGNAMKGPGGSVMAGAKAALPGIRSAGAGVMRATASGAKSAAVGGLQAAGGGIKSAAQSIANPASFGQSATASIATNKGLAPTKQESQQATRAGNRAFNEALAEGKGFSHAQIVGKRAVSGSLVTASKAPSTPKSAGAASPATPPTPTTPAQSAGRFRPLRPTKKGNP
ncbi:hypothetical protein [Rhodoferax ferrireducens]|nr:hypothetical protein [Rhodoferax ferrireducens]